ncbi:hypothetical protein AAC387_Pa12g1129 [Persea americana]
MLEVFNFAARSILVSFQGSKGGRKARKEKGRKRSTALLLFPASPYYVFCKDTAKKKKKKVEAFSDPTSIFFLFDFLEQQSANPRHGFCSPSLVIQNPYLAFPCHPSLLELGQFYFLIITVFFDF